MSTVTETERDRIRQLHARGLSCNAIAAELGRSPSTISRQCAAMDPPLSFDRADTRQAVQARVIDLAAKRAAAAEALADDAERLRGLLWSPYLVHSFGGRDNTYEEHTLPTPDVQSQLNLMRAVQSAWATSMKLSEFGSGDPGNAARSLIGDIAKALTVAAENLPPDDDRA